MSVLPFGRETSLQPYFGVGIGLFNWRYSEVGEFIDFSNFDVFRDRFVASGHDVGGLILGGLRVPFGDRFAAGAEVRYQSASGSVGIDQGFLAERFNHQVDRIAYDDTVVLGMFRNKGILHVGRHVKDLVYPSRIRARAEYLIL